MTFLSTLKQLLGCKEQELLEENQALQYQIDELKSTSTIKEPEVIGTIKYSEAYSLFKTLTPNVFLSDEYFNLTDIDKAKEFTKETKVFARKWTAVEHDCDNFSFALMGYWSQGLKSFAFGIAWSNNHAFNIMIDDKKRIWIVEPQTNIYYTIDEAKQKSTPDGLSYFPIRMVVL